ncbi:MAG: cytochrome b N-terminal domain-containing protein [bacterium]
MRRNFVFHLHPAWVAERTLKPATTFGLGILTLTFSAALAATGALLMIYYVPSTREALASTQDIQYAVAYGSFVRAVHRWAAHGMVLAAFLHLLRVAFCGAYFRRKLNWVIGLHLFLFTLGLAFTGYLLPWDQRSFWAVSVSAALLDCVPWAGEWLKRLLLGGPEVGQPALVRFYALHVAILPGLMAGLVALHLWRIRKDGGLVRGRSEASGEAPVVPAWPHLVLREAILVLALLTLVCLAGTLVAAPLGGAPDVHNPSSPQKTPWYFLWLQEMVSYSAPIGAGVFPGVVLLALLLLPFLEREEDGVGRWFGPPGRRMAIGVSAAVALVSFILLELVFLQQGVASWLASGPAPVRDLLNPAAGMLVVALVVFAAAGRRARSARTACLAAGAVLLVAVIGFGVVGWCRGPMWVFFWPWEEWSLVP